MDRFGIPVSHGVVLVIVRVIVRCFGGPVTVRRREGAGPDHSCACKSSTDGRPAAMYSLLAASQAIRHAFCQCSDLYCRGARAVQGIDGTTNATSDAVIAKM